MAKPSKNTSKSSSKGAPKSAAKKAPAALKVAARTDVRNTAVPKAVAAPKSSAAPKVVTYELIAKRAYEIWSSGKGGSDFENWVRAERELRTL